MEGGGRGCQMDTTLLSAVVLSSFFFAFSVLPPWHTYPFSLLLSPYFTDGMMLLQAIANIDTSQLTVISV